MSMQYSTTQTILICEGLYLFAIIKKKDSLCQLRFHEILWYLTRIETESKKEKVLHLYCTQKLLRTLQRSKKLSSQTVGISLCKTQNLIRNLLFPQYSTKVSFSSLTGAMKLQCCIYRENRAHNNKTCHGFELVLHFYTYLKIKEVRFIQHANTEFVSAGKNLPGSKR